MILAKERPGLAIAGLACSIVITFSVFLGMVLDGRHMVCHWFFVCLQLRFFCLSSASFRPGQISSVQVEISYEASCAWK